MERKNISLLKTCHSFYNKHLLIAENLIITFKTNKVYFLSTSEELKIEKKLSFNSEIKSVKFFQSKTFLILTENEVYSFNLEENLTKCLLKIKGLYMEIIDKEAYILTNKNILVYNIEEGKNFRINLKFQPRKFFINNLKVYVTDYENRITVYENKSNNKYEATFHSKQFDDKIKKIEFCQKTRKVLVVSGKKVFELETQNVLFENDDEINDLVFFEERFFVSTDFGVYKLKSENTELFLESKLFSGKKTDKIHFPSLITTKYNSLILLDENKKLSDEEIFSLDEITAFDYSERFKTFFISTFDENLYKAKIKNDFLVGKTLKGHENSILDVKIFGDSVLSMSSDKTAVIRKIDDEKIFSVIKTEAELSAGDLNSEIIAIVGKDQVLNIYRYSLINSEYKPEYKIVNIQKSSLHTKEVTVLKITENFILTASLDKKILIYDLKGKLLKVLQDQHKKGVWSLATTEKYLFSGGTDMKIRVYNLDTDKTEAVMEGHTGSVYSLQACEQSKFLFSGDSNGNVKMWELKSFSCVETLNISNESLWGMKLLNFDNFEQKNEENFIDETSKIVVSDSYGELFVLNNNYERKKYLNNLAIKQKILTQQKLIDLNKKDSIVEYLKVCLTENVDKRIILNFLSENLRELKLNDEFFLLFENFKVKFVEILKFSANKTKFIEVNCFLINSAIKRNWSVKEFKQEIEKQLEFIEVLYLKMLGSENVFN